MTEATRPAAFIRAVPGSDSATMARERQAVADAACQRGWPAPTVYADEDGPDDTALARLEAAIVAGRHDVLMLAGQGAVSDGGPALLMGLLLACTKNGVIVELLPPPLAGAEAAIPEPAGLSRPAARPPGYHERPAVLTRARVSAMSGLFTGWRIWIDDHGWHARRRDGIFLQEFRLGAPAFCVHAVSEDDLARRLREQEAANATPPGRVAS
ncbi:MAG TPA: hypothetical protein VMC03_10790 [Streptosporangiaceae bacterium]|nr:hypothetical protein [Streptosporangiaceae bacterium]